MRPTAFAHRRGFGTTSASLVGSENKESEESEGPGTGSKDGGVDTMLVELFALKSKDLNKVGLNSSANAG